MSLANAIVPNNLGIQAGSSLVTGALSSDNGNNIVSVQAAPNPTVGQVLTATGANAATWQDPGISTNVVRGGFSGFGAASAATVLTTVTLTDPGAYIIIANVSANINTGTVSAGYKIWGTFHIPLAGGPLVRDAYGTIVESKPGAMGAETAPEWEIDGATTIKLAKTGNVSSVWGGSWQHSTSGVL